MSSSFKQLAADCVERSATSLLLSRTPSVLYDTPLHTPGLDHLITTTIVLRDNELLRATQISLTFSGRGRCCKSIQGTAANSREIDVSASHCPASLPQPLRYKTCLTCEILGEN